MEIQREQTGEGDPEKHDVRGLWSSRFHFLTAEPQLGSGGGGHLGRCTIVVDRDFGMERKEKHERAKPQEGNAPQRFISRD